MKPPSMSEDCEVPTDRLLATCWTSAGNVSPNATDKRSPVDLRERIELASRVGFRGFGIHLVDLDQATASYRLADIRSMLDDNGMVDVEIEGISNWWASAPRDNPEIRRILAAAEVIGVSHVKLNPQDDDAPWDAPLWADRFAELATLSSEIGARLGLEFMPWTNIPDLWSGVRIIEAAGHPNGGLVIDVWHLQRSGSRTDDLLKIPVGYVSSVELNDADSVVIGGLYEDTKDRRRYCGEGTFGLQPFIRALRRIGWTGPWGVEILSTHHRRTRVELALEKAYATARHELELGRAA